MRSDPRAQLITSFYDAAVTPELWPAALQSFADYLGAIGAGYILCNKQTGRVDWISLCGPCAEYKSEYVEYYAPLDPYRPLLGGCRNGNWLRLSECVPQAILEKDEWYNDFVVKSGVGDIIASQLFDNSSYSVVLGVHNEIGRGPFLPATVAALQELFTPLSKAAKLHVDLRSVGLQSFAQMTALDQLSAGVLVVDRTGRVVEMNRIAEAHISTE